MAKPVARKIPIVSEIENAADLSELQALASRIIFADIPVGRCAEIALAWAARLRRMNEDPAMFGVVDNMRNRVGERAA